MRDKDWFWLQELPRIWAEKNQVDINFARTLLPSWFSETRGTLNFTSIDYWTERLGINILQLKQQNIHRVRELPGAISFVTEMHLSGKCVVLVTNADTTVLRLKQTCADFSIFDLCISAHTIGIAKESPAFWKGLQQYSEFKPKTTVLVEDSELNLLSAAESGISGLLHIARHSIDAPEIVSELFPRHDYSAVTKVAKTKMY